ncbi:DMT family transporter [Planctobacterium marinum]|uniref:DMT family transporter n=1 Tax=Planctobacterium marinum TaxID=1631968 RepID=UPI001E46AC34|nr:DMT family transporter [Planctobacterium marinum]MCC2605730.1 DMT family transporter [Planctobacterium marinum]
MEATSSLGKRFRISSTFLALLSLLGCGGLLALSTNLAKYAAQGGIDTVAFLTWSIAGAAILLVIKSVLSGKTIPLGIPAIRYFFVSGFFSIAAANLIFFKAIPHIGVSVVSLLLAMPPLLTYVAALTFKMEKFNIGRAAGVGLALVGALVLVVGKWQEGNTAQVWIIITLLGPVLLAAGNIYRSLDWPKGAAPEDLAPGMLLASAILLFCSAQIIPGLTLKVELTSHTFGLIIIQSMIFAGQSTLLFVLQKVGGPVFLSLIGAVSAAFAVPIATALLGETFMPSLIPSALFILSGIVFLLYCGQKKSS